MPFDGFSQSHPDIERLQKARTRLTWGWVQHHYHHHGAVCISQAITMTCGDDAARIRRLVARELPFPYRLLFFSTRVKIIMFNDHRGTTYEMALGLFDRAIARQEEHIGEYCPCPI